MSVGTKTTKRMKCTCTNTYQDKRYGKGIRVFNKCNSGVYAKWRCTVCGSEKGG